MKKDSSKKHPPQDQPTPSKTLAGRQTDSLTHMEYHYIPEMIPDETVQNKDKMKTNKPNIAENQGFRMEK